MALNERIKESIALKRRLGAQYGALLAGRACRQGFYLPSGMASTEAQVDAVCKVLKTVMAEER